MGLRCSLFGHAFEESVTERDRETRGAEVVVTVREVRTCSRCGAEQVIAENTEVRHLGADDGDRPEPTDVGDSSTEEPTPAEDEEAGEQAEDEGEILDDTGGGDFGTDQTGTDADEPEADITQFVDAAEPEEGPTPAGPDTEEAASREQAEATAEPESEDETSEWDGPPDSAIESEDAEFIGSGDEGETAAEADEPKEADEPEEAGETADSPDPDSESPASAARSTDEDGSGTDEEGSGEQPVGTEETDGDQESPGQTPPTGGPDEGADEDEADDAIIMDNTAGAEDRESDVGRRELAGSGNMFDTNAPEGGDGDSPGDGSGFGDPGETGGSETPTEDSGLDSGRDSSGGEPDSTERWPGEDQGEDKPDDDSSFQFGPDMHPDPEERDEETSPPSGLTTGGTVDVTGPTDEDPPEAVICPECGFEASGVGSSRRAGDICPECHGGYLAERR